MSWSSSLILNEGEQVVHSWEGIYLTLFMNKRGVLVLTNQRLIWLEQRGHSGKSYRADFEIYLRTLQSISMGGTLFKYFTITDNVQQYAFNIKEFEQFKYMIMRQKELAS